MSPHTTHDLDELSEALDGRVSEERRRAVEERLASCPECRAAHTAMAWAKAQTTRVQAAALPDGIEQGVRRRLDESDARKQRRLPVGVLGLAAAAAVLFAVWWSRGRVEPVPSLPEAAADAYRSLADGRLSLVSETADPARLEGFFAARDLPFKPRILDLGMMGFSLRGGRVHDLAGRPAALAVYVETTSGRAVVCLMLREGLTALPASAATREHNGFSFHVYQSGGLTMVFWAEGDVLCVLVSDGDPEALVQLAFAKAMKAAL